MHEKMDNGILGKTCEEAISVAQLAAVRQKLNTLGNSDRMIISYSSKSIGG